MYESMWGAETLVKSVLSESEADFGEWASIDMLVMISQRTVGSIHGWNQERAFRFVNPWLQDGRNEILSNLYIVE